MFALARHDDRLTEACNKFSLLLTANTPFYPVYLWFILGRAGWPWLLLSALSLPFFAATIPIARRHALAGRIWLCVFASLNTFWVTWLLGPQSGTALFFLPCLYLALGLTPHAPVLYNAAAYASLLKLNAVSVAALSVVLPYLLGAARGEG